MATLQCPRCSSALAQEDYEGIPIDRCPDCQGAWLDEGELKPIIKTRIKTFTEKEIRSVRGVREKILPNREKLKSELDCPKCTGKMPRFNYQCTTGILLDKCAGHGIWFDKEELEHVQIVVEECERLFNSDLEQYGPVLNKLSKGQDDRMKAALPGKILKNSSLLNLVMDWLT